QFRSIRQLRTSGTGIQATRGGAQRVNHAATGQDRQDTFRDNHRARFLRPGDGVQRLVGDGDGKSVVQIEHVFRGAPRDLSGAGAGVDDASEEDALLEAADAGRRFHGDRLSGDSAVSGVRPRSEAAPLAAAGISEYSAGRTGKTRGGTVSSLLR